MAIVLFTWEMHLLLHMENFEQIDDTYCSYQA